MDLQQSLKNEFTPKQKKQAFSIAHQKQQYLDQSHLYQSPKSINKGHQNFNQHQSSLNNQFNATQKLPPGIPGAQSYSFVNGSTHHNLNQPNPPLGMYPPLIQISQPPLHSKKAKKQKNTMPSATIQQNHHKTDDEAEKTPLINSHKKYKEKAIKLKQKSIDAYPGENHITQRQQKSLADYDGNYPQNRSRLNMDVEQYNFLKENLRKNHNRQLKIVDEQLKGGPTSRVNGSIDGNMIGISTEVSMNGSIKFKSNSFIHNANDQKSKNSMKLQDYEKIYKYTVQNGISTLDQSIESHDYNQSFQDSPNNKYSINKNSTSLSNNPPMTHRGKAKNFEDVNPQQLALQSNNTQSQKYFSQDQEPIINSNAASNQNSLVLPQVDKRQIIKNSANSEMISRKLFSSTYEKISHDNITSVNNKKEIKSLKQNRNRSDLSKLSNEIKSQLDLGLRHIQGLSLSIMRNKKLLKKLEENNPNSDVVIQRRILNSDSLVYHQNPLTKQLEQERRIIHNHLSTTNNWYLISMKNQNQSGLMETVAKSASACLSSCY
ncbi:UNKNOWN [Stylonychia lemnae]|uniref:Uncharacterized protein n=1 Tax=Stylonychia lemnae TaxID=5949 RepID=A0A078AIQ2_STYLE|nr:UNKNOWN [Stylonychia lemnae]|eukprot:CDW81362.1 UNKNOWN [Stylonychia lemnae]